MNGPIKAGELAEKRPVDDEGEELCSLAEIAVLSP
jgi:hypothetical protein